MNQLPCGKLSDESNAVYHSRDAISATKAKLFRRSALRFYRQVIKKDLPFKESDSLDFGIAFHAMMEGDEAFRAACAINPYDSFRKDSAKLWRATMESQGKVCLNLKDVDALEEMRRSVYANPTAHLLLGFAPEKEVTWRAKVGRFYVQARTDRWSESGCVVTSGMCYGVDYKTTASLLDDAFERDAAKFDYAFQMEFYKEVIASVKGMAPEAVRPRMFIVATEYEPPYETEVFEFDQETQTVAKAELILTLKDLRRAYDEDLWPGRPTGVSVLSSPRWKVKAVEEMALAAEERMQLEP